MQLTRWPRVAGLVVLLNVLLLVPPAAAAPLTLEFSGSIFNVTDPSDVFETTIGNSYSLFVTYDPDLLVGTNIGDFTQYATAAGETAITFSFISSGGDSFTSDNSLPITIAVKNTPDFLVTMQAGDGRDTFSIDGSFIGPLTLSLVLIEGPGSNPLSSNNLPTAALGSGPGTWNVSELDIDRTDLFANISGSVSNIEEVAVPEPSAILLLSGVIGLAVRQRRPARVVRSGRGPLSRSVPEHDRRVDA